jgi:hypothetical protein
VKFLSVLATGLLLSGCAKDIQNKDAVRQGIIDYLSKRGSINVNQMNVEVASVSFEQNKAVATVSFSPKNGGGPGESMSMTYNLEKKGNKWEVIKGGSAASGAENPHGGAMPPAMPPVMPPQGTLPPGHPPANPPSGNK